MPKPDFNCEITKDNNQLEHAKAIVFHVPNLQKMVKIQKYPGQIWVAFSMESDINYPQLRDPKFMRHFDVTMTYSLKSDVPATYLTDPCLSYEALSRPPQTKHPDCLIANFVSYRQDRCGRYKYLKKLMRYAPVDSFGACLNNKTLALDQGRATKIDTIRRYKFTMAFENSITPDYVTEKFFQPLVAGSVPVYRGAPNIEQFAPGDNCFIDARQFPNPRDLAKYLLHLDKNEAEYSSFLKWKQKPLRPRFRELFDRYSVEHSVRLCANLQKP